MDFLTESSCITLQLTIVDCLIKDILAKTKATPDDDERMHHALNCRLGDCLAHRIALRDLVKQLNEMTDIIRVTQRKINDINPVPLEIPLEPKARQVPARTNTSRPVPTAKNLVDTDTDTTIASDDDANHSPDQDRKYRGEVGHREPGPYGSRYFNHRTRPGKRTATDDDDDDDDDSVATSVLEREFYIRQIYKEVEDAEPVEPAKKKAKAHKGKTTSPKYLRDRAIVKAEAVEFARVVHLPEVYVDALTLPTTEAEV
jgi:hypothetical protein